jgi:hypothetical protein
MAFNVKTTMTWSVRGEDQPPALFDARNVFLAAAISEGKTENDVVAPLSEDGKTSERFWSSTEAAEEWKTFLENLAEENQIEVSVEIS